MGYRAGGSAHLAPFGSQRAQLNKSIPELLKVHRDQPIRHPNEEKLIYIPTAGTTYNVAMSDPQPCLDEHRAGSGTMPRAGVTAMDHRPVKSGSDVRRPQRPSSQGGGAARARDAGCSQSLH